MNKKIYEIPALTVTEIETEDVITESSLVDQDILDKINEQSDILGYTTIEVDFN